MHSWVPLGCNNWSHLPGRRLSPPPPTDSRPNDFPTLPALPSNPEVFFFVQELWPEGQASGLHTCGSLQKCPQGTGASGLQPCLCLCFIPPAGIFQKAVYILAWCPDFCGCCQGSCLRGLALVPSGAYTCFRSFRTVNNQESLSSYHTHSRRQQTQEFNLSVKEAN